MTFASCLNCRFALRVDEQESYCRRHAPVVMVPEGYRTPVTRSPNTYDQNWCGDHEPVPKPAIPGVVAVFANQPHGTSDVQSTNIMNEWNCD